MYIEGKDKNDAEKMETEICDATAALKGMLGISDGGSNPIENDSSGDKVESPTSVGAKDENNSSKPAKKKKNRKKKPKPQQ